MMDKLNTISANMEMMTERQDRSERLIEQMKGKKVELSNQLPSQPTPNPRNLGPSSSNKPHNVNHIDIEANLEDEALAISGLRSGKILPDPYRELGCHDDQDTRAADPTKAVVNNEESSEENLEDEDIYQERPTDLDPDPAHYKPPVPFLQALNRERVKVNQSEDHLLDTLKKVTIQIPLLEAIQHIPAYAKFLKGMCTPQRKSKRIFLSETASSIMLDELPLKKEDLGAPMIACEIGLMTFTRCLLDTGASINILPKAVFDQYRVGELQPHLVELCLADGSVRRPHGIVMNIIVKVEHCHFPVDFLVVDMKATRNLSNAPIILGRPFLATARAVTDWGKGEIELKVTHIV
ncbi:uncharacterized protein LOC144701713 [Wolffia australiana]